MPNVYPSSEEFALGVLNVINVAFWALLALGIVIRVVVALARRKHRNTKSDIARPLIDALSVESTAYGWKPATEELRDAETESQRDANTEPTLPPRADTP